VFRILCPCLSVVIVRSRFGWDLCSAIVIACVVFQSGVRFTSIWWVFSERFSMAGRNILRAVVLGVALGLELWLRFFEVTVMNSMSSSEEHESTAISVAETSPPDEGVEDMYDIRIPSLCRLGINQL